MGNKFAQFSFLKITILLPEADWRAQGRIGGFMEKNGIIRS
jgi:hypothetical protein